MREINLSNVFFSFVFFLSLFFFFLNCLLYLYIWKGEKGRFVRPILLDFVALAHLALGPCLKPTSGTFELGCWTQCKYLCKVAVLLPVVVQRPTQFEVGLNEEYHHTA